MRLPTLTYIHHSRIAADDRADPSYVRRLNIMLCCTRQVKCIVAVNDCCVTAAVASAGWSNNALSRAQCQLAAATAYAAAAALLSGLLLLHPVLPLSALVQLCALGYLLEEGDTCWNRGRQGYMTDTEHVTTPAGDTTETPKCRRK